MLKNLVTLKCNYWCAAIKTAFFHHFYPPSSLIESLRMSVYTKFGLKKSEFPTSQVIRWLYLHEPMVISFDSTPACDRQTDRHAAYS